MVADAEALRPVREPVTETQSKIDEGTRARQLVARIRSGERAAEEEMVATYSRGLLFYLRHRCGDPALADDLHQETFKIVLLRLREQGLDDPSRVAGFLRRTAQNLLLAGYRKAARRRTQNDEAAVQAEPDRARDPQAAALLKESVQIVRSVISELPNDRDRHLLYRFYVAEEEKDAICEELDITPGHMKRVLFRARQRFKEQLSRFEMRLRSRWQRGQAPEPASPAEGTTGFQPGGVG